MACLTSCSKYCPSSSSALGCWFVASRMICLRTALRFEASPDRSVTTAPFMALFRLSESWLNSWSWEAMFGPVTMKPLRISSVSLSKFQLVLPLKHSGDLIPHRFGSLHKGGYFSQRLLICLTQNRLQYQSTRAVLCLTISSAYLNLLFCTRPMLLE